MHRRSFLRAGVGAAVFGNGFCSAAKWSEQPGPLPPTLTTTDVVGDGKWIWTDPPKDERGWLEPRSYELNVGITMQGTGPASSIMSTTTVPVEMPEQRIDDVNIQTQGCAATLRQVAPAAGQLVLAAGALAPGQVIRAVARFRMTLFKQYFAYSKERFPAEQTFAKQFSKLYLYDSPGITTRIKSVRQLARKIGDQFDHPWDKALAFKNWVRAHIEMKPGPYTSVVEAIRDGSGDCEERASVFAAFCRIHGIPTRSVWVPNHVWAEFALHDHDGKLHWIPAHTSAYTWFGYTGAHELVLQKGDEISVPERSTAVRFIHDWTRWQGAKPKIRYLGQLKPLPQRPGADPGPGARLKTAKPQWITGNHELDQYLRDGKNADKSPFKNKPITK